MVDQIQIAREIAALADVVVAASKIGGAAAAGMVREVHLAVTMSDGSVERVAVEPFAALRTIAETGETCSNRMIALGAALAPKPEPKPMTDEEWAEFAETPTSRVNGEVYRYRATPTAEEG